MTVVPNPTETRLRPQVKISISNEFVQTPENLVFERQFASNYFVRYHNLKKPVIQAAQRQWPDVQIVGSLKEGKNINGKFAVVGAVYKEGRLKPNVLEELQQFCRIVDQHMVPPSQDNTSFMADSDLVFLEDPETRVQLGGNLKTSELCTGLIVAVCGEFDHKGVFQVDYWTLPGPLVRDDRADVCMDQEHIKTVLFVSGLNLGQDQGKAAMLLDWLMGLTGDPRSGTIAAVVVVGNSVISDFLAIADAFFASLASIVPVIILPGETDPSNFAWPQQPLHSAIFGRAKVYKNLLPTTNPARFDLDDGQVRLRFLGSAGQGVREIQWYTEHGVLESLQMSLAARLLAPTAPDTLACYPVAGDADMLVIREAVDVFFAGNCKHVEVGKFEDTLLLGLSVFAETGETVLVNLRSLTAELVEFQAE